MNNLENNTGKQETAKARPCVHVRMIGQVYRHKPVFVPAPVINMPHWIERQEGGLFETIIEGVIV